MDLQQDSRGENPETLQKMEPTPIIFQDNSNDNDDTSTDPGELETGSAVWCKECTIGDPTIISGNRGGKYTLWMIVFVTVRGTNIKTRRRYSDFLTLKRLLNEKYRNVTYIGKLPPKTYLFQDRFSAPFLEKRRKALEYWLNSVVLNPELASTPEVKRFVLGRTMN